MTNDKCDGFLVIDKPAGLTSRAVVDRVWPMFPRGTRLGHAGTLDPLATGVLVLCVGQARRLVELVQELPKTYQASLLLGGQSTTDDADGQITEVAVPQPPQLAEVEQRLDGLVGEVLQVPPVYSAAKVAGRRAYELARKGAEVALAARPVRIYRIQLLRYAYPHLSLTICCGKGTYIRALARDLGQRLGCGAYIQTLRRTAIGPFGLAEAWRLANGQLIDPQAAIFQPQSGCPPLVPLEAAVAHLPQLRLEQPDLDRLGHGQKIPWAQLRTEDEATKTPSASSPQYWAVCTGTGRLAALCRLVNMEGQLLLQPDKVFLGKGG